MASNESHYLASVDYYKIESDEWFTAPVMNEARESLSFCAQGEMLYAMFGSNGSCISTTMNKIEMLNVQKFLNGEYATWSGFSLASGEIHPRTNASVTPISSNEIVILGGFSFIDESNYGA